METMRLDQALVALGYYESREQAQRALLAGELEINGLRDAKAGQRINLKTDTDIPEIYCGKNKINIVVREKSPFVSRGAYKIAAALDAFKIDPTDMLVLDIGASTGGFTDCVLQRGARKVFAVDCGYGQLHDKIRKDARVISMEKTNARFLSKEQIPEIPQLVVVDVSFISLKLILPAIQAVSEKGTIVVTLVKPQFEVGRDKIKKGGVVTDPQARLEAVEMICQEMLNLGWEIIGSIESPIIGPAGNHEFLVGATIA